MYSNCGVCLCRRLVQVYGWIKPAVQHRRLKHPDAVVEDAVASTTTTMESVGEAVTDTVEDTSAVASVATASRGLRDKKANARCGRGRGADAGDADQVACDRQLDESPAKVAQN
eukprot:317930-Chlamydomonas_euryale.AAC.3